MLSSVSSAAVKTKNFLHGKNPFLTFMAPPQVDLSKGHLPSANPDIKPKYETTLRLIVVGNAFDSIFPFANKGIPAFGNGITDEPMVFEKLMYRNPHEPFTSYAWLASHAEVAPDNSWVRFYIHPQATWADGTPVTAHDVAFSLEILRTQGRMIFRNLYKHVDRVVVENDKTAKFVLMPVDHPLKKGEKYFSREKACLLGSMTVLPKHIIGDRKLEDIIHEKLIGSGPYAYGEVVDGRSIEYVRRKDYWGDKAGIMIAKGRFNFGKVVFKYFREANVAFEGLKTGEGDMLVEDNTRRRRKGYTFDRFTKGEVKLTMKETHNAKSMKGFVMNTKVPPFDNRQFRKAMLLAIDHKWLLKTIYAGEAEIADSYFMNSEFSARAKNASETFALENKLHEGDKITKPEQFPKVHTKDVRKRHKRVLKLLKRAGWVVRNGVCVNEKTGKPLELTVLLEGDDSKPEAIAFARNLRAFGIKLNIQSNDSAQYWRRVLKFDYPMVAIKWLGTSSPGVEQRNRWTSESAENHGTLNFARVSSEHVDKAVNALLSATSYEEQLAATRALDRKLLWRYLVVPTGHESMSAILHDANLTFYDNEGSKKLPEKSFWWDKTDLQ